MNILHVVAKGDLGEINLREIVNEQKKLDNTVSVLTSKKAFLSALFHILTFRKFDIIHLHCESRLFKLFKFKTITKKLDKGFYTNYFSPPEMFQIPLNTKIFAICHNEASKEIDSVIESLKYLPSDYMLDLVLLNADKLVVEKFDDLAKNLNVRHRINFEKLEDITDLQLASHFCKSMIYITANESADLNLKIYKALACGTSVLVLGAGDIKISGLKYTDSFAPKVIAKEIKKTIEEGNLVDYQSAVLNFSYKSIATKLNDFYENASLKSRSKRKMNLSSKKL